MGINKPSFTDSESNLGPHLMRNWLPYRMKGYGVTNNFHELHHFLSVAILMHSSIPIKITKCNKCLVTMSEKAKYIDHSVSNNSTIVLYSENKMNERKMEERRKKKNQTNFMWNYRFFHIHQMSKPYFKHLNAAILNFHYACTLGPYSSAFHLTKSHPLNLCAYTFIYFSVTFIIVKLVWMPLQRVWCTICFRGIGEIGEIGVQKTRKPQLPVNSKQ